MIQISVSSLERMNESDWSAILDILYSIPRRGLVHLELNLSCPNIHDYSIKPIILREYCKNFRISVKLPPVEKQIFRLAKQCAEAGVHYFHCSNTLPSELGGLSGYPLKQVNLPLVEKLAMQYPDIPIIGGGGVYRWQDILDYQNAGTKCISTATIWFRPWKARALLRQFNGVVHAHNSQVESKV